MEESRSVGISGCMSRLMQPPPMDTIRLFKSAIYGIILLNTLFLLPMADQIWGPDSLIMPLSHPDTLLYNLWFMLMKESVAPWYPVVLAVQMLSVVGWFAARARLLFSVLIFVSTSVLFTSAHLYTTGGHTFMKLLLFYLMLIPDKPRSRLQFAMANLFLLACKIQLAIVYLFAGLFKLHGSYWLNGEALYYVLSLREFSHPVLQSWLLDQTVLLKMGTWIGLGYQLLFPLLVWFRKTKMPLLMIGILFHLLVAFGFGLPDFGLFMIVSYTMFVSNSTSARFSARFRNIFQARRLSLKRG